MCLGIYSLCIEITFKVIVDLKMWSSLSFPRPVPSFENYDFSNPRPNYFPFTHLALFLCSENDLSSKKD